MRLRRPSVKVSALAPPAKECRAACLLYSNDALAACRAFLALAAVNAPIGRILLAVKISADVCGFDRDGTARFDGAFEHGDYRRVQELGLWLCEPVGTLSWIDAGFEQRLGSVDIAEPADLGLVEQELFNWPRRRLHFRAKIIERESLAERLRGKLAKLLRGVEFVAPDDVHETEVPLIAEMERLAAKFELGMCESRRLAARGGDGETAAHPKMDDERPLILKIEENVFAASANRPDPGIREMGVEILGSKGGCEPRAVEHRLLDPAAADEQVKMASDELDLG